jgi:hypothetical protein
MILALALSLLTMAPVQGTDLRTTVRVYVFTATSQSGERSEEEQGRLDAVREMKEALAKKKGIHIVEDRADATLTVEVVGREMTEDVHGPFGGKMITPLGDTIIRLHVRSGDLDSEIKGMGQGTWGRAAKDAADRILKWIARREPPR